MDLSNYKLTWDQDFTTMSTLSVTPWGPVGPSGSTWIAHTPYAGDWINFQDPSGPYLPFNIGDGHLTIRAQYESDGKYYGGLLSSVDSKGNGFSQKYGYFEMLAQLPSGLGTWPAFWLDDVTSLVNKSLVGGHEIDILEAYGDGPGILRSTIHYWDNANSKNDWGWGQWALQCSMYSGYHTYGMDIQPDYLTVYYDRMEVMRFPNKIPNITENYDRPMYIMVNLAIGGGSNLNNETNLRKGPQDMLVKYVKVWQGSGGSANGNSTAGALSLTWPTAQFTLNAGQKIVINGTTLTFTSKGSLQVLENGSGTIVYNSNSDNANCASNACYAYFQNDGNLVFHAGTTVYWASNTWGNNEGSLSFGNTPPYLVIHDGHCNPMWSSPAIP
jgi:beta-glucanase (GH16 family)